MPVKFFFDTFFRAVAAQRTLAAQAAEGGEWFQEKNMYAALDEFTFSGYHTGDGRSAS